MSVDLPPSLSRNHRNCPITPASTTNWSKKTLVFKRVAADSSSILHFSVEFIPRMWECLLVASRRHQQPTEPTNMTTEILETRPGTTHKHYDEIRDTITYLTDVVYELRKNPYFTDWVVTGIDQSGRREAIGISRSGLHGESRFYGIY
jgi:hypothetical protein